MHDRCRRETDGERIGIGLAFERKRPALNQVQLACDGLTLGSMWIPPFQLALGQTLCLHMPGRANSSEEDQVIELFTGQRSMQGFHRVGQVLWAEPAMYPRGFLGWLHQPRPQDWLCRETGMTRAEAATIVDRLGLRPGWRLCEIPWTARVMLGLEVVWARGATGIVFSVVGLDPLSRQTVFGAVNARLDRCAAVFLSYVYFQNEQPKRDCFPGGKCIELVRHSDSHSTITSTTSLRT
jgi:hypothetical protein